MGKEIAETELDVGIISAHFDLLVNQHTEQLFPKTNVAYWGSFKSSGQSGNPWILKRAVLQTDIEERLISRARKSFVVRAKCTRSSGLRCPNIWNSTSSIYYEQRWDTRNIDLEQNISGHFCNLPQHPAFLFGFPNDGCNGSLLGSLAFLAACFHRRCLDELLVIFVFRLRFCLRVRRRVCTLSSWGALHIGHL